MLTDIYFVLVRPSFLGNIGATARVMKNFGFKNLRLVAPPRNYKDAEARKMSLGAFDLLKNAAVFETLSDALKDVSLSIGSSCGTQRENELISLPELPTKLMSIREQVSSVAIVFGEERDGLSKDELNRCDLVASIPTDPEFSSLNLSQAVAVFSYELRRWITCNALDPLHANSSAPLEKEAEVPSYAYDGATVDATAGIFTTGQMDDDLFIQLDGLLHEVGFSRTFNRESVIAELRMLYKRAKPSMREYGMLQGMIRKTISKLNFENE